jgi:hypothetical protein
VTFSNVVNNHTLSASNLALGIEKAKLETSMLAGRRIVVYRDRRIRKYSVVCL